MTQTPPRMRYRTGTVMHKVFERHGWYYSECKKTGTDNPRAAGTAAEWTADDKNGTLPACQYCPGGLRRHG